MERDNERGILVSEKREGRKENFPRKKRIGDKEKKRRFFHFFEEVVGYDICCPFSCFILIEIISLNKLKKIFGVYSS